MTLQTKGVESTNEPPHPIHNTKPDMFCSFGPSMQYVTLFLANFDLCPPSHFVTHPGTPESTSHISDPPIFSRPSTKIPDKGPLYKFYLNCSRRFLSGEFVRESFVWKVLS